MTMKMRIWLVLTQQDETTLLHIMKTIWQFISCWLKSTWKCRPRPASLPPATIKSHFVESFVGSFWRPSAHLSTTHCSHMKGATFLCLQWLSLFFHAAVCGSAHEWKSTKKAEMKNGKVGWRREGGELVFGRSQKFSFSVTFTTSA